ncbi:MAG: GAF domain-containing protein [Chloroflexi bacterium]|nr:GAF domain-containing protein [Chloroflexota bacterium]
MDILLLSLAPAIALVLYSFLLFITWRHGIENKLNQRFILYLISMIVWSLGALLMYLDRPHASTWNRFMMLGVVVMPLAFFSFVVAFRRERAYDRILKIGVIVCFVFLVLAAKGYLAGDIHITERGSISFSLGPAIPYFGIYFLSLIGLSALNLSQGRRRTKNYVERNRITYVFIGLSVILIGGITNTIEELGAYPIDITANAINALLLAYTIFRYQLLDIKIVIRKGLLYTVPTVIIGVGYFLIIFLSVTLFDIASGFPTLLLSVAVAALVALIMQPLQVRLQLGIDKLFFREKYDANLMLQRISRTATSILRLDRLANMILDEITSTIHISKAALFLRDQATGQYQLIAQRGLPPDTKIVLRNDHPIIVQLALDGNVLTIADAEMVPQFNALWAQEHRDLKLLEAQLFVPLVAQDNLIGVFVVGPKLSETTYSLDEQLMLSTLANQAAIAVQNAWLYQMAIEEKQRTEVVLAEAFTGIVVVDGNLRVVDMNPAAEKITGYNRDDLIGEIILQLFANMWDENSALRRAIESEEALPPTETTLLGRNGRRDILLAVTPIFDRYLFNFTDITKLKEVGRLQANIVANVSHELRTPLASIKGYADLLLNESDAVDEAMQEQCLVIINNEADRMNRVINALLDLSKLEAGNAGLQMEELSIPALVNETVTALAVQARQGGVTVRVEMDEQMPPIYANRDMLTSILKNLVGNAIKFSVNGGEVEVVAKCVEDHLVLEICDHGLGIPAEDIPHLFTKFYRSKRAHDAGVRGTGLGLALVKEAVDTHHGKIEIDSVEGEGTCVTVTLPLKPPQVSGKMGTNNMTDLEVPAQKRFR